MNDIALLVLYIEIDLAMRVGPHEFRNRSRQCDLLRQVVRCIRSVVCAHGSANQQYGHNQSSSLPVHAAPPQTYAWSRVYLFENPCQMAEPRWRLTNAQSRGLPKEKRAISRYK